MPEPPGPEEPGPTAFGDDARVARILSGAGYSEISIEPCDTAFALGRDPDEAVVSAMQMGPGGKAVAESEADEATEVSIAAVLRAALALHETPDGVILGEASWVVSARNA